MFLKNDSFDHRPDTISNIIEKFESIAKIKENIKIVEYFHFSTVDESMIKEKISSLDKKILLRSIIFLHG